MFALFHLVWICVFRTSLFVSVCSLVVAGWRYLHHESENSQIPLRSPGNVPSPDLPLAVHFYGPFPPSHRFPDNKSLHKHVTSTVLGTDMSLQVSVLFHPFITCAAGENNTVLCRSSTAMGMFFRWAVCVIVLLERKQRRRGVSHSVCEGFFKVDPRE